MTRYGWGRRSQWERRDRLSWRSDETTRRREAKRRRVQAGRSDALPKRAWSSGRLSLPPLAFTRDKGGRVSFRTMALWTSSWLLEACARTVDAEVDGSLDGGESA